MYRVISVQSTVYRVISVQSTLYPSLEGIFFSLSLSKFYIHSATDIHTHTHTYTCTHTNACTIYSDRHIHTYMYTYIHMHVHMHTHTHTYTYIHTHTHMHKHMCTQYKAHRKHAETVNVEFSLFVGRSKRNRPKHSLRVQNLTLLTSIGTLLDSHGCLHVGSVFPLETEEGNH